MKVMLVSGSIPPMKCGVGDYSSFLASSLSKQNGVSKVVVVTSNEADEIKSNSLEVRPVIGEWNWRGILRVLREAKEIKPDIIHIQYPTRGYGRRIWPSWMPLILNAAGFRIVQTWHEPLSWKGWFRYLPNAITRDALVVAEPDFKEQLPSFYRWLISHKAYRFISVASAIPKANLSLDEATALRCKFGGNEKRLLTYFGFAGPNKGVEQLFEIADPAFDNIVLLCELNTSDRYQAKILEIINTPRWAKNVHVTGFLPAAEVAEILAASDAVVLPFINGAGSRNTTLLAARLQSVFVLTTHQNSCGFDASQNVYYARPNAIEEMRLALQKHAGKQLPNTSAGVLDWSAVAMAHIRFYNEQILSH